jgi:hypothetical protein
MRLFLQRPSEGLGISQNRAKTHETRDHRHLKRLRHCTRRGTARICVKCYWQNRSNGASVCSAALSTLMALFGPRAMSDLSPHYAPRRTFATHAEFPWLPDRLACSGWPAPPHLICPDGQINGPIDLPVQPLGEKYSASPFGRNRFIDSRVPPRSEGRFAAVTNVGCGMRWTRRRR